MFTRTLLTVRGKALATILLTMGWLSLALCWAVLAWGRYSLFQNLAGLGISTLLFAAIVGAMWVLDQDLTCAGTILATLGWLGFALYWIGFVWSRHTFLENGATLTLSLFACTGIVVLLWLRRPVDEWR